MSIYLKLMYDQWSHGRSEHDIIQQRNEFVVMASRTLSRTESEILKELNSTIWSKFDSNSVK